LADDIRVGSPACLLLLGALASAGEVHAQPVPVFSSEATLVNVAVTVEDAQGRPVEGLTRSDFVLTEDGRAQTIEMCARMGDSGGGRPTTLDVALLVDTSESMLETLRRSQDAAVRFLTTLPNAQDLIVVFFDQAQTVERFDREHPEALFERVRTIPEGGNTALRDAIAFSLRTLGPSQGRSAIVLLTDGIDTVSATDPRELERAVQASAVTLYPVLYAAGPSADRRDPREGALALERLARMSGGRSFALPNERALPGVLDEIVADLRSQYVLGFVPRSGRTETLRRISVKVPRRGKVVVRHRLGYRLPR
jgi:VWFA-related protein